MNKIKFESKEHLVKNADEVRDQKVLAIERCKDYLHHDIDAFFVLAISDTNEGNQCNGGAFGCQGDIVQHLITTISAHGWAPQICAALLTEMVVGSKSEKK